jgi:hypothetical protein
MKILRIITLTVTIVALMLMITPSAAGQSSGTSVPKYDRATEAAFKGTVEQVRDRQCPMSGGIWS